MRAEAPFRIVAYVPEKPSIAARIIIRALHETQYRTSTFEETELDGSNPYMGGELFARREQKKEIDRIRKGLSLRQKALTDHNYNKFQEKYLELKSKLMAALYHGFQN